MVPTTWKKELNVQNNINKGEIKAKE